MTEQDIRRYVPSVDRLLRTRVLQDALDQHPRWAVLKETRAVVDEIRTGKIPAETEKAKRPAWFETLGEDIARRAARTAEYSLKTVINATGVVLHTNLGRALLGARAVEHLVNVARQYSNLELDLSTGGRGSRYSHVESLLCELTGAEAAIVVNNNAAAVILCLSAWAADREVVISRGELVEIGGSFRIPEVMRQGRAILKEVGATNRTHLRDYEAAITEQTAMLLKVHTSNFRVVGFTASVEVPDLVPLARKHHIPILHDLGAGCFVDLRKFGLPPEPTVQEAIEEGADLVTFSGDKVLGGPQIGVIAGRAEYVHPLRKHQLLRALRVDKLTLAAFEATLRVYMDAEDPTRELPGLKMLAMTSEALHTRATLFAEQLKVKLPPSVSVKIKPGQSQVGAGSVPGIGLDTHLVALELGDAVTAAEASLRAHRPPVMARVYAGDLLVDLRTVLPEEEPVMLEALVNAVTPSRPMPES